MTISRGEDLVLNLYFAPYTLPAAASRINGGTNIGWLLDVASDEPLIYGDNGTGNYTLIAPGSFDYGITGPFAPPAGLTAFTRIGAVTVATSIFQGANDAGACRSVAGAGVHWYECGFVEFGGLAGIHQRPPALSYTSYLFNGLNVYPFSTYICNANIYPQAVGVCPFTNGRPTILHNKTDQSNLFINSDTQGYLVADPITKGLFTVGDAIYGLGTGELAAVPTNPTASVIGNAVFMNYYGIMLAASTAFPTYKWINWEVFDQPIFGQNPKSSASTEVFEGLQFNLTGEPFDDPSIETALNNKVYFNAAAFVMTMGPGYFPGQAQTPILIDFNARVYRRIKFNPKSPTAVAMLANAGGMQIAFNSTNGYFILINNTGATGGYVFHTQDLAIDYAPPLLQTPPSITLPCFSPCIPGISIPS